MNSWIETIQSWITSIMEGYKLLPMTDYNRLVEETNKEKPLLSEKIEEYGKRTQNKLVKLLGLLIEHGVEVGDYGEASFDEFSDNILPYLLYSISRKGGKPANWNEFTSILKEIPEAKGMLAVKTLKDVRKRK